MWSVRRDTPGRMEHVQVRIEGGEGGREVTNELHLTVYNKVATMVVCLHCNLNFIASSKFQCMHT